MTDWGLPTSIQAGKGPDSVCAAPSRTCCGGGDRQPFEAPTSPRPAAAPTSDDRDDNRAPTGELPLPVIVRLDEIPGIAPRAAQIIIAEIGLDMTRFPTANHLVSWAKLSPRTIQSGARSRGGKTGKGNPYLMGARGAVATAAAKTNTFLRSGDAATPRRGPGNPAGVVRDSINPVGRIVRSGFLRHWWAKFALAITRPCPVFAVVRRHN